LIIIELIAELSEIFNIDTEMLMGEIIFYKWETYKTLKL
jgi:hypothetical protein